MEINQDEVVIDGKEIGVYDLYDTTGLVRILTSDECTQEILQQDADTILEVLHNAVDQRVIASFQIVHHP